MSFQRDDQFETLDYLVIKKNLKLDITVITDSSTFKKIKPLGFIHYKLIEPELGNSKSGKDLKSQMAGKAQVPCALEVHIG